MHIPAWEGGEIDGLARNELIRQDYSPANRLPASRSATSTIIRTTLVDRRRTKPTSTTLELSRHRYALTPKIPVTSNDKERKPVMVDTTSILQMTQLSTRRVGRWGTHHPRSTVYLFGEHRDEGGEREC